MTQTKKTKKTTVTYSMLNMFKNCRQQCKYKYFENLKPLQAESFALHFGSVIHDALEIWHTNYDFELVIKHLDKSYSNRYNDEQEKESWHKASAMMRGYKNRYPSESFQVVSLEEEFKGKVTNPITNYSSHNFEFRGKIDGLIKRDDEYWLLEHKTASRVDDSYINKLWTDFQITIYSYYIEKKHNIQIAGILYNILQKVTKAKQKLGETEQEFLDRREIAIDKYISISKTKMKDEETGEEFKQRLTGRYLATKNAVTQQLSESDSDYASRLDERFSIKEAFHREEIILTEDQKINLTGDLWHTAKSLRSCMISNVFYKNTSCCFDWNRQCDYYELCKSGDSQLIKDTFFKQGVIHEELSQKQLIEKSTIIKEDNQIKPNTTTYTNTIDNQPF